MDHGVTYCPAHSGVQGNERVDRLARGITGRVMDHISREDTSTPGPPREILELQRLVFPIKLLEAAIGIASSLPRELPPLWTRRNKQHHSGASLALTSTGRKRAALDRGSIKAGMTATPAFSRGRAPNKDPAVQTLDDLSLMRGPAWRSLSKSVRCPSSDREAVRPDLCATPAPEAFRCAE
ncbi:hypothetical protein MRX96_022919 [Rhipicephalus microplus]